MSVFLKQNPGIGGLEELTDAEELFIQNLAGLSYSQGDILYHNGSDLVRLAKGSSTEVLTMGATVPEWAVGGAGTDVKVGIDSLATAGYIGALSSDGVLRTGSPISYTDGGDYITLDIATDGINDTHIDWGTGVNQVSSCDIPDHDGHTVRDTFVHVINRGVAEAITVTLTGGLGISWTSGEIYDRANHTFVATDAGSGNVTNTAVNYLKWVSGTTLTLSTSNATGDEVLIAIGTVYDGVINGYREMSLLDESSANIRRCARDVFPTRVTSGMSVHEDDDVTNPLDVTMDAGVYCKELTERITPIEIKSRNTAMVRHFHTGGVWDSDTNAQIETTNYDNGTQKTAIPSNKWVKGLFVYMNGKIGFVYPIECFSTVAEAQEASLPAMPTGIEPVPKLTAIVYQQGASDFTTAIWQDVRAGIGEQAFGGVSDHGTLAGLSDDDHTIYLLADGSRALAGAWDLGGQNLTNGGTITASFTGALTGNADTVSTITGLAPDTATTQATQASITTCANLVTVGTIATGVWQGTAINQTYLVGQSGTNTGDNAGLENIVEDTTPQLGGQLDINGQAIGDGTLELLKFVETGSAVNEVTITNAATAGAPKISATGDDANIDLELSAKGTGIVRGELHTMQVVLVEAATAIATDTTIQGDFRIPGNKAITVKAVGVYVDTVAATGSALLTVDIHEAGTTILSTKITVDVGEKTSVTAATPAVISDSAIAADAILTFDVDQVNETTPAKGLKAWIEFVYA